ncbi:diaminopropionate ammonia-lyase [Marispirochaeta aestuarii]|uniref:Diaminopropionate ammonia-lyase n=1 Tax=Marispirochaeta aestuarii TaxID=1963862 RepID=A0A1Y1RSX4_9SPIO|nr:diaminopropionate ammonia-lyase [Marispirochaeta aestuarii]ORC29891.1 diaminopropionate ammonia-lyase [Marispirochaeta aestuarii]
MKNSVPDIEWIIKQRTSKNTGIAKKMFPLEVSRTARKFHRQIPGYKMSPLRALPNLAQMFGVGGILVKDESLRLELNSFKVLGGSFALYRFIQEKIGIDDKLMNFDYLTSQEVTGKLGDLTFASATDGNHGRGLAWAAQRLGFKCVIYVHSGTSIRRIDAIKSYGARVEVITGNYDDAVRQIVVDAGKYGWEIISDTSWEGYTKVPTWIMQGYTTMTAEIQEQLSAQGLTKPSHIFVQAGVGALAAAVIGYYHSLFGQEAPRCIVVEPENAACLYHTARVDDGRIHSIDGKLDTIMAGLACGEPSSIAWDVLKDTADAFVSVPDYIAARGMRIYATPLAGDPFIVSGESGAVTLGALVSILKENGVEELRDFLGIDEDSQILFLNTEGNTDPIQFRRIIWDGSKPVPQEYWIETD